MKRLNNIFIALFATFIGAFFSNTLLPQDSATEYIVTGQIQGSDGEKKEYLLRQKMQVYKVKELMNSSILISEELMGSAID